MTRHALLDRVYHWLMAASVLVLLGTGFLPVLGLRFAWVAPHWIAGVVLAVLILLHVVRASLWQDFRAMLIAPADLRDGWRALRREFGAGGPAPGKPGKYDLAQKLYHAAAATVILAVVVTGAMMMVKIDTPFWTRDPYWLSQADWGIVYVIHDLAAMLTVTLLIVHVYFALRPDKLWMTRSMILGWITRGEYLRHHDPARWTPKD